jgi:hypothetical protein
MFHLSIDWFTGYFIEKKHGKCCFLHFTGKPTRFLQNFLPTNSGIYIFNIILTYFNHRLNIWRCWVKTFHAMGAHP